MKCETLRVSINNQKKYREIWSISSWMFYYYVIGNPMLQSKLKQTVCFLFYLSLHCNRKDFMCIRDKKLLHDHVGIVEFKYYVFFVGYQYILWFFLTYYKKQRHNQEIISQNRQQRILWRIFQNWNSTTRTGMTIDAAGASAAAAAAAEAEAEANSSMLKKMQ